MRIRNGLVRTASSKARRAMALASLTALGGAFAQGGTLYWDANATGAADGGSGTWTSASVWATDLAGTSHVTWNNANNDDAVLPTVAGTITLSSPVTVSTIEFANATGAYRVTGSTLNLTGSQIKLSNTATTAVVQNISSNITTPSGNLAILKNNANNLSVRMGLGGTNTGLTGTIDLNSTGTPTTGLLRFDLFSQDAVSSASTINFNDTGMQIASSGTVGSTNAIVNAQINFTAGGGDAYFGAFNNGTTGFNTLTLNGKITGTSNVTFQTSTGGGGGIVVLNNTGNDWVGNTTFNTQNTSGAKGHVVWGANNALPVTTSVQVGLNTGTFGSGVLDLAGKNQTVVALASGFSTGASQGITNSVGANTSTFTITGSAIGTFKSAIGIPTVGVAPVGASNNIALVLSNTHTGTLNLTGVSTYSGGTTVNGGKLFVNNTTGSATGTGTVTVASGASLGGSGTVGGAVNSTGTLLPGDTVVNGVTAFTGTVTSGIGNLKIGGGLTLNSTAAGIYDFTTTTADKVTVTGGLTLPASGTETLTINYPSGVLVANGTYSLITYSGSLSGAFSTLQKVVNYDTGANPTANFSLVNNANSVDLVVTGGVDSLLWKGPAGGSGTWDTSTSNWSGGSGTFANGKVVTFDDTANSTGAVTVTLSNGGVQFQPFQTAFNNNTRAYILNGAAAGDGIGGSGPVVVAGTGSVTLNNTNNFTGALLLNSGTLVIGSNNAINSTSGVTFSGNATLQASATFSTNRDLNFGTTGGQINTNGFNVTHTGAISGTTALTKLGAGTLTLGSTNSTGFTGTLNVNAGTVRVANVSGGDNVTGAGIGTINVNSGGTFFIDSVDMGTSTATSAANLVLNNGAILLAKGNASYGKSGGFQVAAGTNVSPNIVQVNTTASTDVFTFKNSIRRTPAANGDTFATIKVGGPGRVLIESGPVSSNTAFSGSWEVTSGSLQLGPVDPAGFGEALNGPGFKDGDPKLGNVITVSTGGTLSGATNVPNPNSSAAATTPSYYRAGVVMAGGTLASVGLNANWGGDFTTTTGLTSQIAVYDSVTPATARDVNLVAGAAGANNNIAATSWAGTLVVTPGALTTGGAFNINRDGGTFAVNAAGATLQINSGATVNLGGAADSLTDGTRFVNVLNNSATSLSTFHVTTGTKNVGTVDGTGNTTVDASSTLVSTHFVQNTLTANGVARVRANGTTTGVSKLATLTTGASGQLDLTDNKLVITTAGATGAWNGTNYTGTMGQVKSGRNGANWNGPGLITSQTAAALATQRTTLAVALASEAKGIVSGTALFGGTTVNATDTLVMYTYAGDANLDAKINADDYFQIDSHYNKTANSAKSYFNGDFNYDGLINGDDYFLIDQNFSNQNLVITAAPSLEGVSAVPEPGSIGLVLALGAMSGLRRRKRTV